MLNYDINKKYRVLQNKKFTTTIPLDGNEYFNKANFVDENIITAKANGYVDFALKLGTVMDIYENEEDFKETINYLNIYS